jgi:hypothetical protein
MKRALKVLILVFLLLAIASLIALLSAAQGGLAGSIQWSPFATAHRLFAMGILSILVGALGIALWRLQSGGTFEHRFRNC